MDELTKWIIAESLYSACELDGGSGDEPCPRCEYLCDLVERGFGLAIDTKKWWAAITN